MITIQVGIFILFLKSRTLFYYLQIQYIRITIKIMVGSLVGTMVGESGTLMDIEPEFDVNQLN